MSQNMNRVFSLKTMLEITTMNVILKMCYNLDSFYNKVICNGSTDVDQQLANAIENCEVYLSCLPSNLQLDILNKCMESLNNIYSQCQYYCINHKNVIPHLLNILLNQGSKKVKVQLCYCSECTHTENILKILAKKGRNLKSLELIRGPIYNLDEDMFEFVLLSIPNLTYLILKNIACDKILKVIGRSCFKLKVLDVSGSSAVSNSGIKALLQIEINYDDNERPDVVSGIPWWKSQNICNTFDIHDNITVHKINELLKCGQSPTELCSTLEILNLANTSVDVIGMAIVLLNIKFLKSFGDECDVGKVITMFDKYTSENYYLQLETIYTNYSCISKLEKICNKCINLKKLIVKYPLTSPYMFYYGQFQQMLTSLQLIDITMNNFWSDFLIVYFTQPEVRILQELIIIIKPNNQSMTIELKRFLFKCLDLRVLVIVGVKCSLRSTVSDVMLNKLEKICLNNILNFNTLELFLNCTPFLETLHINRCQDFTSSNFIRLLEANKTDRRISIHLRCLYISNLIENDVNTIKQIQKFFPKIVNIGHLDEWNFVEENIQIYKLYNWFQNNYIDIQLNSIYHWHVSQCFPKLNSLNL